MSQSRALQLHIGHLQDIRSILHSLKNMAMMDVHRLAKCRQAQALVVDHIETVAADFLQFYPGLPKPESGCPTMVIAIGSERGFCGNFNESLAEQLLSAAADIVIAVGARLCGRLHNYQLDFTALAGANSSEEVSSVLGQVSDAINAVHAQHSLFNISVLFHPDEHDGITRQILLPPFQTLERNAAYKYEPLLNLEPAQLMTELVEHYVFSALLNILYISLAAENNQRLQHLDSAVRHLDESTCQLLKKRQIYRQEEITEELEVILLNADIQVL